MKHETWHVYTEDDEEIENPLCSGSRAKCLRHYKKNGGYDAGLRLGYIVSAKKGRREK